MVGLIVCDLFDYLMVVGFVVCIWLCIVGCG